MNEHDRRILAPKIHAADDSDCLAEFARAHWYCQACGRADFAGALTIHHIIGGRGGRADEPCNLLMLCWYPCHLLAEGTDILDPRHNLVMPNGASRLLPKLTLAIQLSLKIRAGEMEEPLAIDPGWNRLTVLHGRTLPEASTIPAYFANMYRRNRPELFSV